MRATTYNGRSKRNQPSQGAFSTKMAAKRAIDDVETGNDADDERPAKRAKAAPTKQNAASRWDAPLLEDRWLTTFQTPS